MSVAHLYPRTGRDANRPVDKFLSALDGAYHWPMPEVILASGLPLFDQAAARLFKEQGMDLVSTTAADFMAAGLASIRALPSGQYQGEDIRRALLKRGLEPHKHQAWGALISAARKRGLLVGTGRFEATSSARTHAHKTEVYEKRP